MREGTKAVRKLRCAVYTRKSSEEGLEQAFNSLQAQREACEAYVASQRSQGWVLVPDRYDDGGVSGGTLERPALKRLLADLEAGLIDVVVVYKIDRLSRSLLDFARLVDLFEANQVTFVSVTQAFSTTSSMGRLTLNVLLSFAQFERELAGERIRDKVAASKARGLWMGGWAPLGYDVENRRLVVNETEAALVRHLYQRFLKLGSVTSLVRELTSEGVRTKRGRPFDKGQIYRLLRNPLYRGEVVHKGTHHPGQHEAIVTPTLFEQVQAVLQESPRSRAATTRARTPSLLKGLLVGADGRAYSPSHTRRRGRLYRYYVSQAVLKGGPLPPGPTRLPAGEIEAAVVQELRSLVAAPEMVVRTWRAARIQDPSIGEDEVRTALTAFDQLWDELFPSEQARLVQLLVERVTVGESGLTLTLRTEGLTSLVGELRAPPVTAEAA